MIRSLLILAATAAFATQAMAELSSARLSVTAYVPAVCATSSVETASADGSNWSDRRLPTISTACSHGANVKVDARAGRDFSERLESRLQQPVLAQMTEAVEGAGAVTYTLTYSP